MVYNDVIDKTGMAIDAVGVAVIVAGAAIGFVASAVRLSQHESDVYRRFRQQLSRAIVLGLELLVAGDIVRTVAASRHLQHRRRGQRLQRPAGEEPEDCRREP